MAAETAPGPAHRHEVQVDREDLDEHDPEPEGGQCQPHDRNCSDEVVGPAVLTRGGQGGQRYCNDHSKHRGHCYQGGSLADVGTDERRDRHAIYVRLAEVTSHQLGEEMAQLPWERAVQAPLPAQSGDCGGGGMDPEHCPGRVPGLHVHQQERGQSYTEYHQHRSRHAPGGITQHPIRLARRPRGGKPLPGLRQSPGHGRTRHRYRAGSRGRRMVRPRPQFSGSGRTGLPS